MPPLPGFIGPSGLVRSPNASAERCINLYAEQVESQRGTYMLLSMPGLRPVALLPSGPVRGLYTATNGRVFAATSTTLFEVFAGWTFLSRGTIHTGTAPASFTDDGVHMVFTVDGIGYGYNLTTNALTTLPLTGPQTFGQLGYIDGRIVCNEPGTRHFWYTPILDALTWPALSFYSAEARPDLLVTLLVDHRELWLFGTQSLEVWFSTGDALSPFARMQNVFIEQGIETPHSVDTLDNTLFWLGGSPRGAGPMWTVNGYQPVRVSTHAVESAMAGMPTVGDAIVSTARHGGHAWVVWDFPSGGETWAFDTATQAWAEWPSLLADGSFTNYPSNTHCSAFGEHLFGDRNTGQLYIWDIEYHRFGTAPRVCRRTSPHVRNEQKRLRYTQFRLEAESGVGLDGSPPVGVDPQVMLRYSVDGGHSWSQGRWRSAGKSGKAQQQLCWYNLGQHRQMAFEATQTDPCKVAWLAAYLEVS
jgi:hypothetical protein